MIYLLGAPPRIGAFGVLGSNQCVPRKLGSANSNIGRATISGTIGQPHKNFEPGGATGGGGWRVRAHVLDSESGGAKGHYPKSRTTKIGAGSKYFPKNFVSGETVQPCRLLIPRMMRRLEKVSKPPRSTPHSDIDGVNEDERSHVDSANEAGQDSGDLERARKHSTARPRYEEDRKNREDRSR